MDAVGHCIIPKSNKPEKPESLATRSIFSLCSFDVHESLNCSGIFFVYVNVYFMQQLDKKSKSRKCRFVVLEYYLYLNVMRYRLAFLGRAKVRISHITCGVLFVVIFLDSNCQQVLNQLEMYLAQGLRINVFKSCHELRSLHVAANVICLYPCYSPVT